MVNVSIDGIINLMVTSSILIDATLINHHFNSEVKLDYLIISLLCLEWRSIPTPQYVTSFILTPPDPQGINTVSYCLIVTCPFHVMRVAQFLPQLE